MERGVFRLIGGLFLSAALALACTLPEGPPATQTLDQLLATGHFRRALDLLTGQENPNPYLLSRAQSGVGEYDAALASAEKALAADPDSSANHAQVAAVVGRLAERASIFKQLGLARRTHKEFEAAMALDPKNQDALWGLMLYSWSAPSFLGGDRAKAEKLANDLDAIDAVRGALAHAALAHERKDAAAEETALKQAVAAADPARPISAYDAHSAYTDFAMRSSPVRMDLAMEQSCAALAIDPTRVEAWEVQVELAGLKECWSDVDALLAEADKFNLGDLAPEYHSALAMVALGKRLDTAESILRRYVVSQPQGDEPSVGQARVKLAGLLEKRGHHADAIGMVRQAIKDDPALEEARKELKKLEQSN